MLFANQTLSPTVISSAGEEQVSVTYIQVHYNWLLCEVDGLQLVEFENSCCIIHGNVEDAGKASE
jgi:hypothetical protein